MGLQSQNVAVYESRKCVCHKERKDTNQVRIRLKINNILSKIKYRNMATSKKAYHNVLLETALAALSMAPLVDGAMTVSKLLNDTN